MRGRKKKDAREDDGEEVTLGQREIDEAKENMRGGAEKEKERREEKRGEERYREDLVGEISGSKKGRR